MELKKIYRGMQNGAEIIEENFQSLKGEFSEGQVLWSGGLIMSGTHTITPNKKLSECKNGWLLKWIRFNQTTGVSDPSWFHTVIVSKHNTGNRIDMMAHAGENVYSKKMIGITDTMIAGHNSNDPGTSATSSFKMILTSVSSF